MNSINSIDSDGIMQSKDICSTQISTFNKWVIATVDLAFILLFPGFFIYHTLLGLGSIGAFAGGYFSYVASVFMLPLAFFYLRRIKKENGFFTGTDVYFWGFLTYFLFIILINFATGADEVVVVNHLLSILHLADAFLIFKMIYPGRKKFRMVVILFLMAMSAIVFYLTTDGQFYLKLLNNAKNPESLATYQGFGRSYLLTFIIVISCIKSMKTRLLIYALAVSTIYLNGSRSEFVAIIFLMPVVEIYYANHRLAILLGIFCILAVISLNFESIIDIVPQNRVLRLLNVFEASSEMDRKYFTVQALQTIYDNPIFGNYGSYISSTGVGSEAHNILSAWVDLGFFGFLYLLIILIWPTWRLFYDGYYVKVKSKEFLLAGILISSTLLLLVISKNFTNMFIGAALGAYANYRSSSNS